MLESLITNTAPGVATCAVIALFAIKALYRVCESFEKALDRRDEDVNRINDTLSRMSCLRQCKECDFYECH